MLVARRIALIVLFAFALSAAHAQELPIMQPALAYDPLSLAARYQGVVVTPTLPDLPPGFVPGDTATFQIGKTNADAPTAISARLLVRTPLITIWKQDGITVADGDVRTFATSVQRYYQALVTTANYVDPVAALGAVAVTDANARLMMPDPDGDPRLYIVFTTDLSEDRDGVVNPLDSQPTAIAPFSSGRALIAVNTSPYPDANLSDPLYRTAIGRALYRYIMQTHNPTAHPWLHDALNWRALYASLETAVGLDDIDAFFAAPDTSLIRPAGLTNVSAVRGGTQLFLIYLGARYGVNAIRDLHLLSVGTAPTSPVAAIDTLLALRGAVDPVTSAPVTVRELFADFAIANAVNRRFGDGRYIYPDAEFTPGSLARADVVNVPAVLSDLTVAPYASRYTSVTATRAQIIDVTVTADTTRPLLAMAADRDPADGFYWSGSGAGRDATLTRTLDLTGVESGTDISLTFDAWHSLADGWNSGMVAVSTDAGTRWSALSTETTVNGSRYGTVYGAAFMGISNPAPPRPFPVLGIRIGGDGTLVEGVSPGGVAERDGVLVGDVIVGYEGAEWTTPPNVIGLLASYAPGETLTLLIQRGAQRIDVPIVLGAHPTRVFVPPPLWRSQSVDLSAYAGQSVLLRFEALSLPSIGDAGFAVDNIAVRAIDYADNADTPDAGWRFVGWKQTDNRDAAGWIAQAYTSGTADGAQPPRVVRILDHIGGDTDDGTGSVSRTTRFALAAGETLIVAVSAVDGVSDQPGTFALTLAPGE